MQVAAIWLRDGYDWEIKEGSLAEMQEDALSETKPRHFWPVDAVGYHTEKSERYLIVWATLPDELRGQRYRVVLGRSYTEIENEERTVGFAMRAVQVFYSPAFANWSYSAVLVSPSPFGTSWWAPSSLPGNYIEEKTKEGYRLVELATTTSIKRQDRYFVLFHKPSLPTPEPKGCYDVLSAEHRNLAKTYADANLVPIAISAKGFRKSVVVSSIWKQPD